MTYDFFSEQTRDDPFPVFERLRDHDPVYETDFGYWYVSRYDDVVATKPYYRSSYMFVSRKDRNLRLRSFDDPVLRSLRTAAILFLTRPRVATAPQTGAHLSVVGLREGGMVGFAKAF